MSQVIFNADDFGRSSAINEAVKLAHQQGVLTSASLMVAETAWEEAVSIAREMPDLAVGLHVVVISGKAVLPPEEIPLLVDENGHFSSDPFQAGLLYFFHREARAQLHKEITAQFERFADTRLCLCHVDGHLHMHLHPTILDLLLPLAISQQSSGIRLPRDDYRLAINFDKSRRATKASWALVFGLLCRRSIRQLKNSPLKYAARVYGLMQSGQMAESYVIRALEKLQVPSAEFYFHPSTLIGSHQLGPNPGDLATLVSSRVKAVLTENNHQLSTYCALDEG